MTNDTKTQAIAAVREALKKSNLCANIAYNLGQHRDDSAALFQTIKEADDSRREAMDALAALEASIPIEGGSEEKPNQKPMAFNTPSGSWWILGSNGWPRRATEQEIIAAETAPRAEEGKLTDIPDLADKLTAHLAKMKLPTDPHGWKVIVRIALIGALEKHLATKEDQTT